MSPKEPTEDMPCLGYIISSKEKTSENSSIINLCILFDKNSSKHDKLTRIV